MHLLAVCPICKVWGKPCTNSMHFAKPQLLHVSEVNANRLSDNAPSLYLTFKSLPQNTAITVASLQATSNLLQQAIAMASAQMAASNNTQVMVID